MGMMHQPAFIGAGGCFGGAGLEQSWRSKREVCVACQEGRVADVGGARPRRFKKKKSESPGKKSESPGKDLTAKRAPRQKEEVSEVEEEPEIRFASPLDSCPALVLNADYQPLSYIPLSLWSWQDVVKAVFLDRVIILATYDFQIRSPSVALELPSVVALKKYQPLGDKRPSFTRYNVFIRDDFQCQYCLERFRAEDLTFDHVIPRSRGGKGGWNNVVTACVNCNYRKGSKLLKQTDLKLKREPIEPSYAQIQALARKYPPKHLHETWRDYVHSDQSLRN